MIQRELSYISYCPVHKEGNHKYATYKDYNFTVFFRNSLPYTNAVEILLTRGGYYTSTFIRTLYATQRSPLTSL
jgi:hypothetical protein